jgi:hypothetical protein
MESPPSTFFESVWLSPEPEHASGTMLYCLSGALTNELENDLAPEPSVPNTKSGGGAKKEGTSDIEIP